MPGFEDMRGFPYLYITKPELTGLAKYASGVCVNECPKEAEVLTVSSNCRDAGAVVTCPLKFKETFRVEMFCMPRSLVTTEAEKTKAFIDLAKEIYASSAGAVFADIGKAWGTILLTVFSALFFSIVFTWIMSKYARCLAYFSLAVVILSTFGFGLALII